MEALIQIEKEASNLIAFVENTYGDEATFKKENLALYSLLQHYGESVMELFPTSS